MILRVRREVVCSRGERGERGEGCSKGSEVDGVDDVDDDVGDGCVGDSAGAGEEKSTCCRII